MKIVENIKKYREMNDKDLKAEFAKANKELTIQSLKVKAGKAENISQVSKLRKNVARILTIMNEKTSE